MTDDRSRHAAADALTRARSVLTRTPVLDGHNDLPWAMRELVGYDLERYDLSTVQADTHTDLVRLATGGVGAQFWSVYVPSSFAGDKAVAATLEQIDFVHRMVDRYPGHLTLTQTADQVRAALERGSIACLLGAEGGHCIAESLGVLRALRRLGVRYLTLTHFDNVSWADSATDEPRLGGLNDFGRDVVREMNRIGMLVDLAHVSAATMRDALDVTGRPVIFSHSSCAALVDNPRNVPDDVLKTTATNGGLCMVSFVPSFVSAACYDWEQAVRAEMAEHGENPRDHSARSAAMGRFAGKHPCPTATIADVAGHVEHVRDVAGLDHVGLGGDYDGCDVLPAGLEDVSCYPALIAELLDRGWSEADCGKLTSGNALRVLADNDVEPPGIDDS